MAPENDENKVPSALEAPALDPFEDDEPLTCGLENPDVCESCQ